MKNFIIGVLLIAFITSCDNSKSKLISQRVDSIKKLSQVGQRWTNSIGIEFVFIPSGEFEMGSNISEYEQPIHLVKINRPYALSTTEITMEHFKAFMNENQLIDSTWIQFGQDFPLVIKNGKWEINTGIDSNEPIVWVTYLGAKAFCRWLSKKDGLNYRLPSESEWEYACKAGTKTHFYYGDKISSDIANFNGLLISDFGIKSDFRGKPLPVKSFSPNQWGLYDMHGNVWEFCEDYWHDSFNDAPIDMKPWANNGDSLQCVIKGGSWFSDDKEVRSAVRFGEPINEANAAWGFRIVVEL
jgi:formylglycine-generating enzyme required for sulfatase activity